jgi:Mce-associated membrane protein
MTAAPAFPTATPSWYDLLGVEPVAPTDDVRAAWKAAIADLDPTDRRFRLLNQAAEVLLDGDRRAAYDAELLAGELDAHERETALADSHEEEESATPPEPAGTPAGTARSVPGWLLVAVAAVAALVVGACAVVAATATSDASIADATRQAQVSAERAIVPILSYDARDLDASQRAAEGYLTADYRAEYDKLFEVIKANAPGTGTTVTAEVVASGIVRSGDDRVSVLVFVNRPTTNKQLEQPVVYKDQVTITLQKVGDDWLVDDLLTSPAAG